jgi:hypothetical protein
MDGPTHFTGLHSAIFKFVGLQSALDQVHTAALVRFPGHSLDRIQLRSVGVFLHVSLVRGARKPTA